MIYLGLSNKNINMAKINKFKISILDAQGMNPGDLSWDKIKLLGDIEFFNNTTYDQITERAKDADIVVVNKCKFDKYILDSLPKLKYICESATGYDNIDVEYAASKAILVSNVKDYSTTSVVQHVFALIFALTNKVEYYSNQVFSGRWSNSDFFAFWDFPIHEIAGKTMGIYGFGQIGSKVAKAALAFDMKIIANRRNPSKGYLPEVEHVEIDDLISNSDILSLHAPQTGENTGFINAEKLLKMKKSALLINTARGKIVNEQALADALNNGIIAGAGLDVLSSEPPDKNNPLLTAKNCIITPHQAWASFESRKRLLDGVIHNIESFLEGNPVNIINKY
jgi:glycerate dehydrogenase